MANDHKALDLKLSDSIQLHFRFYWLNDFRQLLCNYEYFFQLSPDLQGRLGNYVFSNIMDKFNCFFQLVQEEEFKFELLVKLRPLAYIIAYSRAHCFRFVTEQVVIKRGSKTHGVYFILKGKIDLCDEDTTPILTLPTYSYFGDHILCDKSTPLNYMCYLQLIIMLTYFCFRVSTDLVQCLYIDKKTFLRICDRHPYTRESIERFAYTRLRQFAAAKRQSRLIKAGKLPRQGAKGRLALFKSLGNISQGAENYSRNKMESVNETHSEKEISHETNGIQGLEIEERSIAPVEDYILSPVQMRSTLNLLVHLILL